MNTVADVKTGWERCRSVKGGGVVERKVKSLNMADGFLKEISLPGDLMDIAVRSRSWLVGLDELPVSMSRGKIDVEPSQLRSLRDAVSSF